MKERRKEGRREGDFQPLPLSEVSDIRTIHKNSRNNKRWVKR